MASSYAESELKKFVEAKISAAIGALLSEKHLYQSVRVDGKEGKDFDDEIQRLVDFCVREFNASCPHRPGEGSVDDIPKSVRSHAHELLNTVWEIDKTGLTHLGQAIGGSPPIDMTGLAP